MLQSKHLGYLNPEQTEENLTPVFNPCHILTSGISVEQERVLELEIEVFSNGFCSIFHAQSVHDGEAMPWRGWPEKEQAEIPSGQGKKEITTIPLLCSASNPLFIYL